MVSGGGGVSVYGGESVPAAEVGDAIVSAARGQSDHEVGTDTHYFVRPLVVRSTLALLATRPGLARKHALTRHSHVAAFVR